METIICEKGKKLPSPKAVHDVLKVFEKEEKEMFFVFYLNSRHEVNNAEIEFIGGWNKQLIDCKPVLKKALLNNSISVIVAHNHPSGSLIPSNADIKTTRKLREALELLDIELNDHLIFSTEGFHSMKENFLL
ncbi:MAG: JAB domain-containing protein [Desulfuromonadales bacterium]|nr:JAB domain-containing protein [Desulfuromonadales bacterium]